MANEDAIEAESRLVRLCIDAATQSRDAVESWRRQRRTVERLPSQIAAALLRCLLRRRLLYPSLLEIFKYSIEEVDLSGENLVDAEWMAYLGAFHYLISLNIADCHKINNHALWAIVGLNNLKEVNLSRCFKVTDVGIRHLLSVASLEKLHISETGVTAEGVALLSSLANLSVLDLGGLPVTDLALCSLQVLTKLQHLDLWGSEISNKGASVLRVFPLLSFLNLAWTKVTELPNLSSLTCLNMSNCTVHSIFKGSGDEGHISTLILSGATYADISEAFLYIDTSSVSFLDMSNSSLDSFSFLSLMISLEHLDLSTSLIEDDSIEIIATMGTNLRTLNLNKTRITSVGVGILAGNVPKLEEISLPCTQVDDLAISYISLMPSLKVINLSKTNVKGFINLVGHEAEIPSFTTLQNLRYLQRLDLEDTQVNDEAIQPLSGLKQLNYLSFRSNFLTDASLYLLSSVPNLTNLCVRDAIFTNAGLDLFNPPAALKTLDLRGCWLLTRDALLSFCKRHPRIEVRHELVCVLSGRDSSNYSSPSRGSSKSLHLKQKRGKLPLSPFTSNSRTFLDQRLKYSREELLAMKFSSLARVPPPINW